MPEPTYVVSPDQVSCDLAGEAAILNLKSGTYYGLDPVGAFIWGLLKTPRTFSDLHTAILAEYDVAPETAEADLKSLLADLASHNLLSVSSESLW